MAEKLSQIQPDILKGKNSEMFFNWMRDKYPQQYESAAKKDRRSLYDILQELDNIEYFKKNTSEVYTNVIVLLASTLGEEIAKKIMSDYLTFLSTLSEDEVFKLKFPNAK